jgi:hypothetical protein
MTHGFRHAALGRIRSFCQSGSHFSPNKDCERLRREQEVAAGGMYIASSPMMVATGTSRSSAGTVTVTWK